MDKAISKNWSSKYIQKQNIFIPKLDHAKQPAADAFDTSLKSKIPITGNKVFDKITDSASATASIKLIPNIPTDKAIEISK